MSAGQCSDDLLIGLEDKYIGDIGDMVITELDNEIDNLPPPNTYVRKFFNTPPEVEKELKTAQKGIEKDFKKWLIKNKPDNAVMTMIETTTAVGVPDIFCCYAGFSSWIECKTVISQAAKFRGTQYSYLKKLIAAGGHAKIAIQRLNIHTYKPATIEIYNAADIVSIPINLFKKRGQDLVFPPDTKPYYFWRYRSKDQSVEELFQKLLLDITDFIW